MLSMCECLGLCACLFFGGSVMGYFAMKECYSLRSIVLSGEDDKLILV